LFLDAKISCLNWQPPAAEGTASFAALGDGLKLMSPPLAHETEITGPMALKLYVSSSTTDADFFVTVQGFSPDGREVEFQGTIDPHTPLAQGWLRASHRKLIPKSLPTGLITRTTTSSHSSRIRSMNLTLKLTNVHRVAGWLPDRGEHYGQGLERPRR
jgi:hypothetical protein